MSRAPIFLPVLRKNVLSKRYKSSRPDAMLLAGALGLLSPQKDFVKNEYKPSIFRSLQDGAVTEKYAELQHGPVPTFDASRQSHQKLIASLMADLQNASQHVSWAAKTGPQRKPVNLQTLVKSLRNEEELLDLLREAYVEKTLTYLLLMQFLLNKHLRDLSKLPFDVTKINREEFAKHGWSRANFTELKVILLKKYHDLEQPLEIIKQLKTSFSGEFLPKIRARQLLPFYERIVWKFYFEYIGLGQEITTIETLDSLRSSLLIWEATTAQNAAILLKIALQHVLNTPQQLFIKVASCKPVQDKIDRELTEGRSPVLSGLKRISGKFKIYEAVGANDVASRAYAFSLIHTLEDFLATHFPNHTDVSTLELLLHELKAERKAMISPGASEEETVFSALYAH